MAEMDRAVRGPSKDWLMKMADAEDAAGSVSVGGLAADIAKMEQREQAYADLLGEICATFSIERNRENIREQEHGPALLEIADRWIKRYEKIRGPQCTAESANWCPIHGDCCCKLPEVSKDDYDCPLHSPNSLHGEIGR